MNVTIRTATAADAELLTDVRVRQLLDEGSAMRYDTRADMVDFFRRRIGDGSYIAYIAEDGEGKLISTAALLLQEYPPSISWKGARRGYVASVYTVPDRRGEGWATRLLERLIAEARRLDLGCLWLLASGEGKSVYKRLGFEDEQPFGDVYMEWYEK